MRKRSVNTRKTILNAASQLFLESGYTTTTVDDIARRAKVTKRTIYGYFPDKQALFNGVIEIAVGDPWHFDVPIETIATEDGLYHALYAIATAMNDIITQADYIRLLRLVISELPAQPDLNALFRHGITRRALRSVNGLLSSATSHGLLAVANPELLARQFIGGLILGVFLDGLLQADPTSVHKLTQTESTDYVQVFMQNLQPRIN